MEVVRNWAWGSEAYGEMEEDHSLWVEDHSSWTEFQIQKWTLADPGKTPRFGPDGGDAAVGDGGDDDVAAAGNDPGVAHNFLWVHIDPLVVRTPSALSGGRISGSEPRIGRMVVGVAHLEGVVDSKPLDRLALHKLGWVGRGFGRAEDHTSQL